MSRNLFENFKELIMKNILLVILLFCSSLLFSQEGVKIESITFKEALVKAEQQKKLVLIDGYTSWCGPCKWMKKQFKSAEAGLFFNKHFVFLEFDMEKEGKTLDEKYKKGITAQDWNSARYAYYLQHYKEITPMMDQESIAYVKMAALWSHFYNYLTGMITPKENYGAELKNEIPSFRILLENAAIPDRDFYLAMGDLSESQFLNDKIAYERDFNKVLSFPVDEEVYDVLMKSLHLVWGESSESMKIENKTGRMLEEKLNRSYEKK